MKRLLMALLVTGTILLSGPLYAASGIKVYSTTCISCHQSGVGGAPKIGDKEAWRDRIKKGELSLYKNAKTGFIGKRGYMPPKGGYSYLSDSEVEAAARYMIFLSR